MASVILNEFKRASAAGSIIWGSADIRARLVMTNTTCDTENAGVVELSDYTTIDKSDSGGYADVALTGEVVNKDDGNGRAELDANDVVFSGMTGNATRDYQGVELFVYVDGTNANDLGVAFIQFGSNITKFATVLTVPWDAEGILHAT